MSNMHIAKLSDLNYSEIERKKSTQANQFKQYTEISYKQLTNKTYVIFTKTTRQAIVVESSSKNE